MPAELEDVSRLPRIMEGLLRKGYSESDIRKILGENPLGVLTEAERIAARAGRASKRPVIASLPE
jgi:membrane dipeptidase